MSAILSADDLNDFISPGVACIKPVETLPAQRPNHEDLPYEVTKADKPDPDAAPASISLTDCLACSGCVTSAEAVLVSLQSHTEVLNALDTYSSLELAKEQDGSQLMEMDEGCMVDELEDNARIFVASVSPQVRASLAATYNVSEIEAGNMIDHFLSGPEGLVSGGPKSAHFTWVIDTNAMREVSLTLGADEVLSSLSSKDLHPSADISQNSSTSAPQLPVLSSACPGWICYAEKTHPHILPHLSRLKSPQALTGTLLKAVLSRHYNIPPSKIWHLAIMPCFDKKLEASREELTDVYWRPNDDHATTSSRGPPTRDVDCVITARELLMLADSRGISFPELPRTPLQHPIPFPDPTLSRFLFPPARRKNQPSEAGTSGGYLHHILSTLQSSHPGSTLQTTRGRNADVIEYTILPPSSPSPSSSFPPLLPSHNPNHPSSEPKPIFKAARYYGFHNIQNLVRKLKPPHMKTSRMPGARTTFPAKKDARFKNEYAYVEVMACPGGCTNGGGQIKGQDLDASIQDKGIGQKEWLAKVDEAYFSGAEDSVPPPSSAPSSAPPQDRLLPPDSDIDMMDAPDDNVPPGPSIPSLLSHCSSLTNIPISKLAYTTYRRSRKRRREEQPPDFKRRRCRW